MDMQTNHFLTKFIINIYLENKRFKTMKKSFLLITSAFAIAACSAEKKAEGEDTTVVDSTEVVVEDEPVAEIIISPVEDSPIFEGAKLTMKTPSEKAASGTVKFSYDVENYELAAQTSDATVKQCANSGKGQHIHLILNNQPYSAHYEAAFEKELEDGHYVALSFLSRSYHESIKEDGAAVVTQFTVGETDAEPADLSAPHMFYSRPKGTYTGADTKKLLLDFYLVNTTLAADGNKVRATINGQEFMIDQWTPYFVEGLPMGENTFKLELLDKDGQPIPGPFNSVERTVTLQEAAG